MQLLWLARLASISLGAIIGSLGRYALNLLIPRETISSFPWNTLITNLLGAFVAGIIAALSTKFNIPKNIKLFIFVGILGAFTSFSAFALENFLLLNTGKLYLAITNIVASNTFGILLFSLGFFMFQFLLSLK